MWRGSGSEEWLVGNRAKGKLEEGERTGRGGGLGGLQGEGERVWLGEGNGELEPGTGMASLKWGRHSSELKLGS